MKNSLRIWLALAISPLAVPAMAGDLVTFQKAPTGKSPLFDWTGFYIGGTVGYALGEDAGWPAYDDSSSIIDQDTVRVLYAEEGNGQFYTTTQSVVSTTLLNDFSVDDQRGFSGGAQIGYNYQTSGRLVLGMEADIQFGDITASGAGHSLSNVLSVATQYDQVFESGVLLQSFQLGSTASIDQEWADINLTSKIEYFGTVRGRVGYAFDRFLPYITGGLAYAQNTVEVAGGGGEYHDEDTYALPLGDGTTPVGPDLEGGYGSEWTYTTTSVKKNFIGWTLGGGFEYAFDNHWTMKTEYLYVDLGRQSYDFGWTEVGTDVNGDPFTISGVDRFSVYEKFHTARIGVNYKF